MGPRVRAALRRAPEPDLPRLEHRRSRRGRRGRPRPEALQQRRILQGFFDYADERVAAARAHGRKGGLAAWRDTAMFKVTYAWGLRRREAAMLDTTDFSTNPAAPELVASACCRCASARRCGAARPAGATSRTVMPWAVEVLQEYLSEVRPCYGSSSPCVLADRPRGGGSARATSTSASVPTARRWAFRAS